MLSSALSSGKSSFSKSTIGRPNSGSSGLTRTTQNRVPGTARAAFRGLSLMAPRAAASLAESIFLKPIRLKAPLREQWWATDAEEITIPRQGGRALAGWSWGWSGPVVLLVHGWGGRGLQMGAFAAPLVEAGFRVVAFDAPGHGRSPGSKSSLPEFAAAIEEVCTYLGGVDAIIAHSFGAAATTMMLGTSMSSTSMSSTAESLQLAPERLVYVAPASDFGSIAKRFSDLTGFTPKVVGRMRRRIEKRLDLRWQDVQPQTLAESLSQDLLIFHDLEDEEVPIGDSRLLQRAWPKAELHESLGLGHHGILRQERVVARAVAHLTRPE